MGTDNAKDVKTDVRASQLSLIVVWHCVGKEHAGQADSKCISSLLMIFRRGVCALNVAPLGWAQLWMEWFYCARWGVDAVTTPIVMR